MIKGANGGEIATQGYTDEQSTVAGENGRWCSIICTN